jgi:hypothetical protein
MKNFILTTVAVLMSLAIFSQTPSGSFECHISAPQSLPVSEIINYISKINFENYRLKSRRTTLSFDNGFEIVLLSASEAQARGLLSNASTYQGDYIAKFKLPVFHMTSDGKVSAAYPVINSKYTTKNH